MTAIEILIAACVTLRAEAVAVGRTLETRRVEGAKMRELASLETTHRAAWSRFYTVDCRLHSLTIEHLT